jgi:hypothetical protein
MAIFEGCSQGFWGQEQHFDSWVGFTPAQQFDEVFDRIILGDADLTLEQAINPEPPLNDPVKRLALQAVAALLNAAHPDVDYPLTVAQVIQQTQIALDSNDAAVIDAQAQEFNVLNNLGCPLD